MCFHCTIECLVIGCLHLHTAGDNLTRIKQFLQYIYFFNISFIFYTFQIIFGNFILLSTGVRQNSSLQLCIRVNRGSGPW